MIKYNTQADITPEAGDDVEQLPGVETLRGFKNQKKEKKKKKKSLKKYYVHKETSNPSFLKMYRLLGELGIENRDFFLALYDKRLKNVDPFDPDLDMETKIMVACECKRNYWYFIRECVRLAVDGAAAGEGKKYALHRGNLALSWCLLNSINFFLELPRQNGKSVSIDIALTWLRNFGTSNTTMLIMNKAYSDAVENLGRIRSIIDGLPAYLRYNWKFNKNGERLAYKPNKYSDENEKNGNKLITKPSASSKENADKLGRGMTASIIWWDEYAFLKFNTIINESASPAFKQASIEAKNNGSIYCKMISTTPGDLNTEYGKDAYEFRNNCIPFKEEWYSKPIKEVKEIVAGSKNGYVNIAFSYKQLGRASKYYDEMLQELNGNTQKLRREVLLEWLNISDTPVFEQDALDRLLEIKYMPSEAKTIYINKIWMLNMYQEPSPGTTVMLSCDTGGGASQDYTTIAVIDTKTKECIGEFNNHKIDTVDFANVVYYIATELFPKCCIGIERNFVGIDVITILRRTDIADKLYREKIEDTTSEKHKDGFVEEANYDNIRFGITTTATTRNRMFELLLKTVNRYPERVRTPILAQQIKDLVYRKKGDTVRIDHPVGGHDDMVMGYNIGNYIMYEGKQLDRWDIHILPDVEPGTDLTPEEVMRKMIEDEKVKQEKEARQVDMLNNNAKRIEAEMSNNYQGQIISGSVSVGTYKDLIRDMDGSNSANRNMVGRVDANRAIRRVTMTQSSYQPSFGGMGSFHYDSRANLGNGGINFVDYESGSFSSDIINDIIS